MGTLTNSGRLIAKIEGIGDGGTVKRYLTDQPQNPEAGDVYYNISDKVLKIYNGTTWDDLSGGGGGGGGSKGYIDVLIIGGGGGGGSEHCSNRCNAAGGGGAGGFIECYNLQLLKSTQYDIVVGQGGRGGTTDSYNCDAYSGCPSCFMGLVAEGGGAGHRYGAGSDGASGGGGACGAAGGQAIYGDQGHNGGNSLCGHLGGGGGGAGGDACDCNGGIGRCSMISGSLQRYSGGGGGGGGNASTCPHGLGGCGGGGDGGAQSGGQSATYYGGGGGGAGCCTNGGGAGCQGIVIIRYSEDLSGIECAIGGNSCVTCNGYKIHCFTSDGSFTIMS